MIKEFCDCCGEEINHKNKAVGGALHNPDGRLGTELKRNGVKLRVEIMTSMDGTANNGHFCKHCILDALYKLDDRPKEASKK